MKPSTLKRKRRPTSEAPPPSKRGVKPKFTPEVNQETGEVLDMHTRARQAREITQLRKENEELRLEREQIIARMEELNQEESSVVERDPQVLSTHLENQLLKRELSLFSQFISTFSNVVVQEVGDSTRVELYNQGAESAHTFLLGLLSESKTWRTAQIPDSVDIPLPSLEFRFAFRDALFGRPEREGGTRLHLRLDAIVPGTSAPLVQDLFYKALCTAADMKRLYGQSPDVHMFRLDSPDVNTELLYFRRTRLPVDQHSVFIVNKRIQTMTRSSFATGEDEFGTLSVHIVAMATSSQVQNDDAIAVTVGCNAQPSERIKGTVIKGVFVWQDDEQPDSVRIVVIYSVPEDYKIINELGFQDIVENASVEDMVETQPSEQTTTSSSSNNNNNSSSSSTVRKRRRVAPQLVPMMSPKFAEVLARVSNEFKLMVAEGLVASAMASNSSSSSSNNNTSSSNQDQQQFYPFV
jgi:hypothetical protein